MTHRSCWSHEDKVVWVAADPEREISLGFIAPFFSQGPAFTANLAPSRSERDVESRGHDDSVEFTVRAVRRPDAFRGDFDNGVRDKLRVVLSEGLEIAVSRSQSTACSNTLSARIT